MLSEKAVEIVQERVGGEKVLMACYHLTVPG